MRGRTEAVNMRASRHLASGHQGSMPEPLQVSARIPDREASLASEPVHSLFALSQKVQQEGPRLASRRPSDPGEVLEKLELGSFQFHGASGSGVSPSPPGNHHSIEYLTEPTPSRVLITGSYQKSSPGGTGIRHVSQSVEIG